MKENIKNILGNNIRSLREASEINQSQLGEYLGFTQVQISHIEKGERTLSITNLRKISDLFDVSMRELIESEITNYEIRKYAFRTECKDSTSLEAKAFLNNFANKFIKLKEICNYKRRFKNSGKTRQELGISDIHPIDIEAICKLKNINLIYKNYKRDSFSGIAIRKNDENFILINSSQSLGRQNYTFAHEYYHLFFENNNKSMCRIFKTEYEYNQEERNAEKFAINFLITDKGIEYYMKGEGKNINQTTLEDIIDLELFFKVSHSAMLIKLLNMRVITEDYKNRLSDGIIKEVRRLGVDTSLYQPTNEIKLISPYRFLVKKAYQDKKISDSKFLELLWKVGYSREDIVSEDKELAEMEETGDI
jgi:Zn-dependent peptidase ImmA (M78 family)/DNA-binding XRE family transcriptional regulator